MEKFKMQCCTLPSGTGNFSSSEPKPPVQAEAKLKERSKDISNKPVQKPWSVFGDVYWI